VILRRLYLYLVSAAGLALLAVGIAWLGITILLFVFNDPQAEFSRTTLAGFAATTLVALPVWGIHFWFARRFAQRDPAERGSAIRRLYVYWACLVTALASMSALAFTVAHLLRPVIDSCHEFPAGPTTSAVCQNHVDWLLITQGAWAALVFLAFWALHLRIAIRDRALAGEHGASATLRRWYMYIALVVGMLTMLSGAQRVIQLLWVQALNRPSFDYISDAAGNLIAGGALWGFHAWLLSRRYAEDDRRSTLRALSGFIVVAVAIATALSGAGLIIYYGIARTFGVRNPGGASDDIATNLASPVSLLVVYGIAWFLVRRRLARDAGTEEGQRQAAIRRLYTNLASLVSLAAFAIGVGGVLWYIAEEIEAPLIGVPASDWKDNISRYGALIIVGAAVWFAHWRPAPWAEDRQSFSRKLYLWAALLASVLAVLGYGIFLIYAVLQQLVQQHPRLNDPSNLDFGHYLAALLVAVIVGIYHWRVLRADAAARPARAVAPAPAAEAVAAPETTAAPVAPSPGKRYVLTVVDATEDDLHSALAALPPQASYKLIPTEESK
jgi:hypothetical protein